MHGKSCTRFHYLSRLNIVSSFHENPVFICGKRKFYEVTLNGSFCLAKGLAFHNHGRVKVNIVEVDGGNLCQNFINIYDF